MHPLIAVSGAVPALCFCTQVCKEVCEEIDLVKKLDAEKRAFMSPTPVGIDRARVGAPRPMSVIAQPVS